MKNRFTYSITIFILVLSLLFGCAKADKPLTAAEFLDLGEKYLLEMDYEQAVVQFLKVIEVEPMNPRGYTGAAEAYVALGEKDKAVDILKSGLELLPGNAPIQALLNELISPDPMPEKEPEKPEAESETPSTEESELAQLAAKLIALYDGLGYESILDEMRSAEFGEILSSASSNEPTIFNSDGDIGCGFYMIGDKVFVYVGEYNGLLRSGSGTWLNVNATDNGYYVFTGNWAGDMPNGDGKSISARDEGSIEKQEGSTYSLKTVITGTYRDGLVDGAINEQWTMDNGHTHNWNLTAANGRYSIVGAESDGSIGRCTECDADLTNDSINGVKGFAE